MLFASFNSRSRSPDRRYVEPTNIAAVAITLGDCDDPRPERDDVT
jgi:hypothetical protein